MSITFDGYCVKLLFACGDHLWLTRQVSSCALWRLPFRRGTLTALLTHATVSEPRPAALAHAVITVVIDFLRQNTINIAKSANP